MNRTRSDAKRRDATRENMRAEHGTSTVRVQQEEERL
jgi:hypothetical protein